jgi:hypothetical protein
MKTIWKYEFSIIDGEQSAEMPKGADIVHVGNYAGVLCAWAVVAPSSAKVTRRFVVHGTGHPIETGEQYLGTAQIGPFVWHLFET